MLESVYNWILFVLAVWGAVRFGQWIFGRAWAWWWKATALIITAAAIGGLAGQISAGAKGDLRIVTELLATAGLVYAGEWTFRHVHDLWGRTLIVLAALVFLFITWRETIDRMMGSGVPTPAVVFSGITVESLTPTAPTRKSSETPVVALDMQIFCAQELSYETREEYCK